MYNTGNHTQLAAGMIREETIIRRHKRERNHGIDLLRIISTFYIIILHTLGLGGILARLEPGTSQYTSLWFLEIWASCAVNIFVIISGYAGYSDENKRNDWSRLIILWLQTVFYGVFIALIYKAVHPEKVSAAIIRNMFFPLTNDVYWFFSAYTGLFIFKPFLNAAVRSIDEKNLKNLVLIVFLAFCCFSMAANPFRLTEGYSFSWFVVLYLIGASVKKCRTAEKTSAPKAFAGILALTIAALLWKIYGNDIRIMNLVITKDSPHSYISPVTVLSAVFHVILFSKLRMPKSLSRIISFFAPGAFAVYLINTHPSLWLNEFENRFSGWANLKPAPAIIRILGYSALFVGGALLIDKGRQLLFKKLGLKTAIHQVIYGPDRQEGLRKAAGPFFLTFFFIIWGFLFWKCPIGYGNVDESLYLTIPYRLLRWGDGLLVHEWHLTQMSAFPMLPVTMLYNLIFPNTERIILNFRLIYTLLWGCSALFFYHRLKSYSKPGAAIASLAFLIYAPYGIMAFSYNSLGILFLLNSGIIGMTASRYKKTQYVISGIFLAGAILCCPYLLVLYILLTISALTAFLIKQNKYLQTYWLFATAGSFLLFAVFCAFLFSRASLQDIIRSIPAVLDDTEHSERSFISKTLLYFSSIWHASPVSPFFIILFTGTCILSKIRKHTAERCLSVLCLGTIVWLFSLTARKTHINYLMFPICLTGFFCVINSDKKSILHIFYWIWIPGMIYTYCLNYSSNQGLYAITNAATVSAFASIMIIVLYIHKTFSVSRVEKIILISSVVLMLASQIGSELYLRYQVVFWENGVSDQKFSADIGPEKDILMTESHLKEYNRILAETEPLRTTQEIRRVLFFTRDPVLYLCTEKAFGTFSSWFSGINEKTFDKLELFYKLNPDMIPDGIYLPQEYTEYMIRFESMGYHPSETDDGNFILIRSAEREAILTSQ